MEHIRSGHTHSTLGLYCLLPLPICPGSRGRGNPERNLPWGIRGHLLRGILGWGIYSPFPSLPHTDFTCLFLFNHKKYLETLTFWPNWLLYIQSPSLRNSSLRNATFYNFRYWSPSLDSLFSWLWWNLSDFSETVRFSQSSVGYTEKPEWKYFVLLWVELKTFVHFS